jgi:hypothetical protein
MATARRQQAASPSQQCEESSAQRGARAPDEYHAVGAQAQSQIRARSSRCGHIEVRADRTMGTPQEARERARSLRVYASARATAGRVDRPDPRRVLLRPDRGRERLLIRSAGRPFSSAATGVDVASRVTGGLSACARLPTGIARPTAARRAGSRPRSAARSSRP